jgi:hypothetical protein
MNSTTFLVAAVAVSWLVFALRYYRQAVWLLLLWIPLQGWVQLNLFDDSSTTVLIYEFQVVGIYLVFLVRALRVPGSVSPPRVLLLAIPFAIWSLLLIPSSVAANGLLVTLVGLRTHLLTLPLLWIGYRTFETRREVEMVGSLLMLELPLVAAVTVSQFLGVSSVSGAIFEIPRGFTLSGVLRPPGTFSAPVHLGMYLLFSIPFALGLLGLKTSFWMRASFATGLMAAIVALMANTQRATFTHLALTLPLIVLVARRRQALAKVAVALCVVVAGGLIGNQFAGDAFQSRIASIVFDVNNTLILNPIERLTDALETPVFGGGLGIASPGASRFQPAPGLGGPAKNAVIKPAESFIPALVYETGVPGLLLFYVFIAGIMYRGLQAARACRPTDMALLAAAIFCVEVAILLQSWPYDPLHYPPSRVTFWIWAGALLRLPGFAAAVTTQHYSPRQMGAAPRRRLVRAPRPAVARGARVGQFYR